MALANVASELARRGKSVLVADFDLEAPGLSSFAFHGCAQDSDATPGLVDFVHSWLDNGRAPDIQEYVCVQRNEETSAPPIYVMPAGKMDTGYGSRLHAIDFSELYRDYDGYLLFEDLRAQWQRVLKVDYVLIDSRTGHTDIGGICTRQLPDLVAFVFWPNIQNLNGLGSILGEIHEEENELGKKIERVYVPSNLPTMDDEQEVLRELLLRFRRSLSYDSTDEVRIHNYPSLDLLQQKIFTIERPKSRLAREDRTLTEAILGKNPNDVDGVRLFLAKVTERPGPTGGRQRQRTASELRSEALLQNVMSRDWDDAVVNRRLALIRANEGDLPEAIRLLEKAATSQNNILADHLYLAEWRVAAGVPVRSASTIDRLLNDDEFGQRHVIAALRLLPRFNEQIPYDLETRPAVQHLSATQLTQVALALQADRKQVWLAGWVVAARLARSKDLLREAKSDRVSNRLSLSLIGGGFFNEAIEILKARSPENIDESQRDMFNLAMASWGASGQPPMAIFEDVLAKHMEIGEEAMTHANYAQCIGLALAVTGRTEDALEWIGRSRTRIEKEPSSFSCWSYLQKGELGFAEDIDEMRAWIDNGEPVPAVFRDQKHRADFLPYRAGSAPA